MTPERLAQLEQLGTKRGEGLAMIAVHVELCTAVRTLMDERDRIVADTRRQVAEEHAEREAAARADQRRQIIADLERRIDSKHLDGTAREWLRYARSVVRVVTDRIEREAAIARGSGGDETARQEP